MPAENRLHNLRLLHAAGFLLCVTLVATAFVVITYVEAAVSYAGAESDWEQIDRHSSFDAIAGGCLLASHSHRAHKASRACGSVGSGCRTVECFDVHLANITVLTTGVSYAAAPTWVLRWSQTVYGSSADDPPCAVESPAAMPSPHAGSATPLSCWRAADADLVVRATIDAPPFGTYTGADSDAGFRCGNPPCVKVDDPAAERASLEDELKGGRLGPVQHLVLGLMVPLCLGCTCGYCALQRRQKTTAIEAGEPEASPAAAEPALA